MNAPFLFVLVAALGFFSYNAQRLVRYLGIGHAEPRSDHPWTRLRNVAVIGIGQSKILRDPFAGILHASVFWGFIVLTVGSAEVLARGVFPRFGFDKLLPAPVYGLFLLSQELFAGLVLAAVAVLLYRRLVIKPKRLQGDKVHSGDAVFILSMIAALMVTLIVSAAFDRIVEARHAVALQPISAPLAMALRGLPASTAAPVAAGSTWIHAVLLLVFLNYLPYSKHLHVITSLPNTFFSNTSGPGQVGVMRPMDLEAEGVETFGAADVRELSWKNLLDGYSCTECGRCTAACPANITGKPLSPRKIVVNVRQRTMELAPIVAGDRAEAMAPALVAGEGADAGASTLGEAASDRLLDTYITEDELWACTSCRACVQECPVSIDQLDVINELRRNLVLTESRFPEEIQPAFEALERNGAPWKFQPADRGRWADGLNVTTMAEFAERNEMPDVLFWVGCMGSFDARNRKVATAFAKVMQAANVHFGILGPEEACTGDPARRIGNEYLYYMLATQNIETIKGYGFDKGPAEGQHGAAPPNGPAYRGVGPEPGRAYNVKTVVATCPHCFNTIKNEYPQLGGNFEVMHHTEFIDRLISTGQLTLPEGFDRRKLTYHDPCFIGRWNGVYDEPRRVLNVINREGVTEMARNRNRSFCCGGGGGRVWMEEKIGKRINNTRVQEALDTGAEAMAAACPFCITMFEDGIKAVGANDHFGVEDISEILARALEAAPVAASGDGHTAH